MKKIESRDFLLNQLPQNSTCVEIGAWKGDFSRRIIELTKPSKLYLVDPYRYFPSYGNSWYGNENMNQEKMDSIFDQVAREFKDLDDVEIVRKTSVEAASNFGRSSLDWVYIDGDHTYTAVLQDLELYFDLTKVSGFVCGDDYDIEGWWENGVTRAVTEFCDTNSEYIEVISLRDNQFILRKIGERSEI